MREPPAAVHELLASHPDHVVATVLAVRDRVLRAFPSAHEIVWDANNAVSLVYSLDERWRDTGVVHVAAYSKHVNLGFNHGAGMDDPLGILAGSGAAIRHVRVEDPEAPWIEDYVRGALDHLGFAPGDGDGGTTVRSSTGTKRRPRA